MLIMTATMTGSTYSYPPVTSNMMTTKHTVMRVIPPSTADAPTMAYTPGVMHEVELRHGEKKPTSPISFSSNCARVCARADGP